LGNASDSSDIMNGDLLVKVSVENTNYLNMKRVNDDIHYNLEINLIDAIFGCKKEIITIENKLEIIEVKPGTQNDEKIIFEKKVKFFI
jgi:DnaJ-class molecular chaperone